MLCNSGLVSQRLLQHQRRVSVLTSLSFGITEPLQSFPCGYLRLKERSLWISRNLTVISIQLGLSPCILYIISFTLSVYFYFHDPLKL